MAGALVVSSALVPFGPKAASAATIPGLDPAFGDAGLLFSPTMQTLPALAATPDGGVLIGAFFDGTSSIRRYTPNGTLDPTFAPASTTPGSISASLGSGLEIDGAGRIYAAGPTTFDPKIVRYLPDGQVDPTFDLPPWSDSFSRFEVLPNGDVVAMSTTSVDSTLVRFSSDGHLDTSFNPAGVNPGTVELTTLSATDFAVRPDGSVIVVGQSANHGAIARVSSSGTIDSSFGAQAAVDQLAVVWNVAVDNANRVVLAVPVSDGEQTQLIRLTPDGLVDASFGASGRITVAARGAWPGDLVVDASGRIVLGGNDPNVDAAVFRFLADGSPDPTLSGGGVPNGRLRVPVGERSNVSALFPLPDGRLVIGGVESISLTEQRGFVARLLGTATATSGGGFNPVAPNRILDTRNGIGAPASKLVPGSRIHLKVTGTPDIPTTGVAAVTMNVTVSSANSSGYVTVFPCNIEEPVVSNLNYAAGQD
ncbi:MAG TPA: hypothetical protein VGK49_09465, partial [Ilumatobacteraceae bacterium]